MEIEMFIKRSIFFNEKINKKFQFFEILNDFSKLFN